VLPQFVNTLSLGDLLALLIIIATLIIAIAGAGLILLLR
jgi:hypothetical protein